MISKIFSKKTIQYIAFLIILSSCSQITNLHPAGLYKNMDNQIPEGSQTFQDGWNSGCTSGLAASGSLFYKMAYNYTYDETQVNNRKYYDAWKVGFRHCRWYVGAWTK